MEQLPPLEKTSFHSEVSQHDKVSDLLTAAGDAGSLDRETALYLGKQAPLPELLAAASELRARGKGAVVSFSKKVFIPLTTLCRDYCGYCTFRKDPGEAGAHTMTPEEVVAPASPGSRSEEHTSELQSHHDLVCRLLLEKKKKKTQKTQ